jgi:hypothetical protein
MILTRNISLLSAASFALLFSFNVQANELMSKAQYADYSVRYQCAKLRFHDDLVKQEQEILNLETDFDIGEENFEAFDEMVQTYEKDDALLDEIRARVSKECA